MSGILATQVEMNSGTRWLVGFVDAGLAVRGAELEVSGEAWTVTAVYKTEEKQRKMPDGSIEGTVAWCFRARRM
jgi:hypothetical protein